MRKLLTLGCLLAGMALAQAVNLYKQDGIQYVSLEGFAQKYNITVTNNVGDITLSKGEIVFHLADYPQTPTLNGKPFKTTAPATNINGEIVVPLIDVQKAFGLQTTPPTPVAKPLVPTPAPASAPQTPAAPPISRPAAPSPSPRPTTAQRPVQVTLDPELLTKLPDRNNPITVVVMNAPYGKKYDFQYGFDSGLPSSVRTEEIAAYCANLVFSRLKSPSTAKFQYIRIAKYSDNTWYTYVSLDAQNSYGALIRSGYHCTNQIQSGRVMMSWDSDN